MQRTLHSKRKRQWYRKYSEKAISPNKQKEKKKKEKTRVAIGAPCISKADRTKGRGFDESIKMKTKQNKTNVTAEEDVMISTNPTPRGYKFTPLATS